MAQKWNKLICGLGILATSSAFCWGDLGHGAVGYIAELKMSPEAKQLVHNILGVEPLAVSAVFPDQVRSDGRFRGFSPYHFLEIPPGYTYDTIPADQRVKQNAHTIVDQAPQLLLSKSLSRSQKMILLRYLVHVVGDVHQPLHVGNGHDMGANLCLVKWVEPEYGNVIDRNLHSVWDENLIANIAHEFQQANPNPNGSKRWFGYRELGDLILKELDKSVGEAALKETETMNWSAITAWYEESRSYHPSVYPDPAGTSLKPTERPYCRIVNQDTGKVENGRFDPAQIPTLSPEYIQRNLPIVKKQILLGGYRLAGLLNRTANNAGLKPLDPKVQEALLKQLMLENDAHHHEESE